MTDNKYWYEGLNKYDHHIKSLLKSLIYVKSSGRQTGTWTEGCWAPVPGLPFCSRRGARGAAAFPPTFLKMFFLNSIFFSWPSPCIPGSRGRSRAPCRGSPSSRPCSTRTETRGRTRVKTNILAKIWGGLHHTTSSPLVTPGSKHPMMKRLVTRQARVISAGARELLAIPDLFSTSCVMVINFVLG